MLVAMKHHLWAVRLEISSEGQKSLMRITVALVDKTRRVMTEENVDTREARERLLHLRLIE